MNNSKLIAFLLISLILISSVSAQLFGTSKKRNQKSYFSIDYALFKTETEGKTARLEVYYQILNAALRFEKLDDIYEAEYKITVALYKKGKKYDSYVHNQVVHVADKSKSVSKFDYRTNQINFLVEEGKYEVIATLHDPIHNSEKIEKFKVKIKSYNKKNAFVSDIELIQGISKASSVPSVFDKGELQLIPSVRHKYGVSESNSFYFYMELYQGRQKEESVRVETVLRHEGKGMLYRDSLTTIFNNPIERQFRELSLSDLRPGKYELIITLRGKRNKKIATQYKDFEILWTTQSLIKFDYDVLVRQIELVATKNEVDSLKGKETYEERLEAFNKYWDKNDPTVGTFENETKNEFYRRVAVANLNFSYLFGNGWKSDRGRIYIMYGEPDQIDDYPLVPEQNPYQEWHYYHGTQYLKFIFVDSKHDGDYRLVYPYDGLQHR